MTLAQAIAMPTASPEQAGEPLVCWLQDCRKDSVPLVGGKCASLGELINAGVRVPPGFALTTAGYRRFMADAGIAGAVRDHLQGIDMQDLDALELLLEAFLVLKTDDARRDYAAFLLLRGRVQQESRGRLAYQREL